MLMSFAESEPRSDIPFDSFLTTVRSYPSCGDLSPPSATHTHDGTDIWHDVSLQCCGTCILLEDSIYLQMAYGSRCTWLFPSLYFKQYILIQHKLLKTNTTVTAKQGLWSRCLKITKQLP